MKTLETNKTILVFEHRLLKSFENESLKVFGPKSDC